MAPVVDPFTQDDEPGGLVSDNGETNEEQDEEPDDEDEGIDGVPLDNDENIPFTPPTTTATGSPRDDDRAPQGSPSKRRWTKLSSPRQEPITVGQNSQDNASTVSPATSEKRRRIIGKQPHSSPSPSVVRRSSEVLGEACGITALEVRALHRLGAPPILFWLLAVLLRMLGPRSLDLDCVEWYSGIGEVHAAMQRRFFASLPYDVIHDDNYQDMTTAWGFITALEWARRMTFFGFSPFGTVCSSWVWVCRSTTGRSVGNVLGDENVHSVKQGNLMVARMMFLYMLLAAKRVAFVLEQPSSSMMANHPKVAERGLHSIHTWMACFGAPTAKPSRLYSNEPIVIDKMKRSMTKSIRENCSSKGVTTVKKGVGVLSNQVTGGKLLKETQCYTREYAEALTESYMSWRDGMPVVPVDENSDSDVDIDGLDAGWDDCDLDSVVQTLKRG